MRKTITAVLLSAGLILGGTGVAAAQGTGSSSGSGTDESAATGSASGSAEILKNEAVRDALLSLLLTTGSAVMNPDD